MHKHAFRVGILLALALVVLLVGSCGGRPKPGSPGHLLWHYRMGGAIFSTPVVSDGVVYFGSNDHHIYALDADSGEFLWRFRTGGEVRSSPTVSDGVVYVGSDDGHLYALDATSGKSRWRYHSGGLLWSTTAVADGIVLVATHSRGGNSVFALDTESGSLLWQFTSSFLEGSSPVVAAGVVYVNTAVGGGRLYALEAKTGITLWRLHTGNPLSGHNYCRRGCSPEVANGVVYFGSESGHVYAVDANTGKLHWRRNASTALYASPKEDRGVIYFAAGGGVIALDAARGEFLGRYRSGQAESPPVIAGGVVYVNSSYGHTHALDAKTGELQWTSNLGANVQTSPAVANDAVYIGTEAGALVALSASDGELMWRFQTGIGKTHSPVEEDRIQHFSSRSGLVYAMNAVTGQPYWQFVIEDKKRFHAIFHAVLENGVVYFVADSRELDDRVYALNAVSGEIIWQKEIEGDVIAAPMVAKSAIYVGSREYIIAVDAMTSESLWLFRPPDRESILSIFAVDGSDVYVGTRQGHVYALDSATGEPIWQSPVGEYPLVTFGDGIVYVTTFPGLVSALDAEGGELLWQSQASAQALAPSDEHRTLSGLTSPPSSIVVPKGWLTRPAVANGLVYVGSNDDSVYAFDANTGVLQWHSEIPGAVALPPVLSDSVLYVASDDHYIYALDADTGVAIWHHDGGSYITAFSVLDDVVFVSNSNDYAYAITAPPN